MNYRRKCIPLSELPARQPRSITVDLKAYNGTRWSSGNWMNADLARITHVSGMLPSNHLTDRLPAITAFAALLDVTVKPETFDFIMSNEDAFNQAYAAYRHIAQFQSSMKKPAALDTGAASNDNNITTTNAEPLAGERTSNV